MKFREFFKNNLSGAKYIKNRKNISNINNDTQNKIIKDYDKSLDKLAINDRQDNMMTYLKCRFRFFTKKMFYFYIPIILVLGNAILWILPTKKIKTANIDNYKIETITFDEDHIINATANDNYFATLFKKEYVDSDNYSITYTPSDYLVYTVTNGDDGMKLSFSITSDGKLSLSSAEIGFYSSLNDEDIVDDVIDVEYNNIYSSLFDDIVNYISKLDGTRLRQDAKDLFLSLTSDEKSKIIIEFVDASYLGEKEVDYYTTRWFSRILLGIISLFYGYGLYMFIKEEGMYFDELNNCQGQLCLDEDVVSSLSYLNVKYKQAFIDAEIDRINKINQYCLNNCSLEQRDKILTNFEKTKILQLKHDK